MEENIKENVLIVKGPEEGGNSLDYIFEQCDLTRSGYVATSQLITFLAQLFDGTGLDKDLLLGLRSVLDPSGKDAKVDRNQFHKAMEEWEKHLKMPRAADNIEIIGNSPGLAGNDSYNGDFEKNWKTPAVDTDDSKDQLRSSNNELMLQKKWLEEQNADLILLLKNSEESNTTLQSNCDSLKKKNDDLQSTAKHMKILRAENEELKELLIKSEGKCSDLTIKLNKLELEALNHQNILSDLESEKSTLKTNLELYMNKEKEYLKALDLQSEQILSLSEDVKAKENELKSEVVKVEELKVSIEGLLTAIKNHEEEKEELEERLSKAQEHHLNMTPARALQSSWKLSPKYVAGLCSYEEVRDECKTLYKDLYSVSPTVDVSENQDLSIETELKAQADKPEEEFEIDMPEAKLLCESFKTYMESLKEIDASSDAMVQVHHQRSECLSEMTIKEAEEAEVDVESRVRAGDDAWMQFHADEGSEAPSCACSHEAGHPSPERLRRLQVVREVAALRSQILRSQAVLAALAQSSDLLGVPEAASAARGVSDYGDVYDVRSVGSNATQHGHQPRSMESVAPSLPCVGGRASSGVLGTTGVAEEEDEEGAAGEAREGRRQLTKSCPALASQVSIATQVDVEDLLTPPPSRGEESAATATKGASSPKRARSSSFLAAIEGVGARTRGESEEGEEEREEGQELLLEGRSSSPSQRIDDTRTTGSAPGSQTLKEDSEEAESSGESTEPHDLNLSATVFEPRVDPLDLDEYRSVRKLSVLPEENEESLAGGGCSEGGVASSSPSTSCPHRSSLRRSRASPTPPPYRPPPNPYRPHSRSFESYLDPENCLRRKEEGGPRQGVPRQCSDPTPAASFLKPSTSRDGAPEDSPHSPLRHSSTSRPLELFGGGPKAVRFDGSSETMSSGDFRRKASAFSHRRLCPLPPSTSPLAEEEETVRTPNSPGGDNGHFPRMDLDQEGRESALDTMEEEDEAAREAGGSRRIRTRRRSTPGSPAAAIKRSAAVDYGEGVEEGGTSSEAETAPSSVAVPFPSLTDPTLCKLGLLGGSSLEGAAKPCDAFSEQDIESKFTSLSLAFKTDKITLGSRLELQQRQRDLAEKNVLSEIKQLKSTLNCLNHLCTDMETTELLGKIRHQVDVLQHSTQRVSSHAEMYGAVQQENRVSAAIEVMLLHVENLKRLHEKDHGELEDTKRILLENNIIFEGAVDVVEEGRQNPRTARYRSLQSLVGANKMGSRRRASIAAIPRMPGRMDVFISANPMQMDVGGVGRVSAAGPLITSTTTSTTTTTADAENEKRRESFASQLFGYGNCVPTESPERSGWSVTPPGEEEDDIQVGDDASEGGTSSWEGLVASAAEAEEAGPLNPQPISGEDSSKSPRRSLGSGELTVFRRDGLAGRGVEGKGSDDRWAVPSPVVPTARSSPPVKVPSLSGVFREWLGRWTKMPWLGRRTGSALVQDKSLTLLHARHCITCILLVVAVISLGATIVSTDAQADRWHHQMADYRYKFWKILRPYITVRHYGPPPM